ncbi:MAG: L-fucose:H+ symporter permease [Prevotellaceae bacterium]|jgi:FHS family L-fucose permease-like MFS transporter|nr:L-fucose:H+ symporter permease [Prevotellaceae bacterium]
MNNKNNKPALITPGYVFTFALVTLLFFMWALPNVLNDVLIKQFQKSLELTRFEAGLIQTAIKLGYFCLAIPAGLFMQRYGYKSGILTGLLVFATGCFLFYPAAGSGIYFVFLSGIFVIGSGLSFLELGANSFITSLGDPSTSARRLNLAQSFNPIGGITGVTLGTLFIFSGNEPSKEQIAEMKAQLTATGNAYADFLQTENSRVWPTYIIIGIAVLIVAFLIWKTKFPKVETSGDAQHRGSFRALLKYPHWYGAIISQFFYLGAQLGTWSYLITYVQENSPMTEKQAGGLLVVNMIIFMAGRFFSTYLMKWIQATRLMGIYALVNIGLVAVVILGSEWASWTGIHGLTYWIGICAMMATTFFMSLMYPTNFASGVKGLGPHAKLGASMLVMSLIGGALLTPLIGLIAEASWAKAIAPGMIIPAVSYGVICWYAFRGSRLRGPVFS